jgi:hypothetical protein
MTAAIAAVHAGTAHLRAAVKKLAGMPRRIFETSMRSFRRSSCGWGGRIRTLEWRNQNPLP